MTYPILTIIIPTYNRANHLKVLLNVLRSELEGLESQVRILVSDNASSDHTHAIVSSMCTSWQEMNSQRHSKNVGPDKNFISCLSQIETPYFWFIGDDDCPKHGIIRNIVSVILETEPALIHMQSEGVSAISGPEQGTPVREIEFQKLTSIEFAKKVHIWTTFISGMVISKTHLDETLGSDEICRFDNTSLVQLGWVLPLLQHSGPFVLVKNKCILATIDNTGGYSAIQVFCINFPKIVNSVFGAESPLSRAMISSAIKYYLPDLVWNTRKKTDLGDVNSMKSLLSAAVQLRSYPLFLFLLVPLGKFPHFLARPIFMMWRAIKKIMCSIKFF